MNAIASAGPWRRAWQRLRSHRAAMLSLSLLIVIAVAALLGPLVATHNYYSPDWDQLFRAPDAAHWFGTDALGRDMLVRVLWGCRVTLLVGLTASLVSVAIGVAWGATAGYLGGRADAWMMRTVDVLYSVPFIPFVIVLTVLFGRHFLLVFAAIGAVSWLDLARIVRGQTISLKEREFIVAARTLGVRAPTMVRRHLLPNLAGIVVVYAALTVPSVILFEALLSFLGLGVQPPLASLGSLVADGVLGMQSYPWLLVVPALFLAAIILCLNLLGDALRDALDPRERAP